MNNEYEIPKGRHLLQAVLEALVALGGSAKRGEVPAKVAEIIGLPKEALDQPWPNLAYETGWSLTHLKKAGATNNTSRGTWTITAQGEHLLEQGPEAIREAMIIGWAEFERSRSKGKSETDSNDAIMQESSDRSEGARPTSWKEEVLDSLRTMSPKAFEKLAQLMLRESGFEEVTVLGRSGDGGIDGEGFLKISLLTFRVYFQCKRYKEGNNIGPGAIREFRGALRGRNEKGLFLTTSSFSSEARREASREGAEIDLIDGDQLCDLLKSLGLGIHTQQVEVVDGGFFRALE